MGERVMGELALAGRESKLTLRSESNFPLGERVATVIHGRAWDGKVISCFQCIVKGDSSSTTANGESFHSRSFFPHSVIMGERPLSPGDETITSACFATQDLGQICLNRRSSGRAHPAVEEMATLIGAPSAEVQRGAVVAYFNGPTVIVDAVTVLGRVQIVNHVAVGDHDLSGIAIKNDFRIHIDFETPVTLSEVERRISILKRYLGVVAGRRQVADTFSIVHLGVGQWQASSLVTTTMEWSAHESGSQLQEWDLPLHPSLHPDEFASVMTQWLQRDADRLTSRVGFAEGWSKGTRYTVDRLVAAANMFDLLPGVDVPAKVAISDELSNAVQMARKIFREIDSSPQRDSFLSALGRVGNASLTAKVLHRSAVVTERLRGFFPDLDKVLTFAVKCRNYCVHGGEIKIDPAKMYSLLPFLTDALEFVYLVSDLLDCGWNAERWCGEQGGMNHPMLAFRFGYLNGRESLREHGLI